MNIIGETAAWLTEPANWQGPGGVPVRMAEQIAISGVSLLVAALVALPIGLWIGHTRRWTTFAVNLANLGRALPSLAVIGIVLPITAALDPQAGFKFYPTLIAMIVLAIPPILVNANTGVSEVDEELTEAARGMGLRERQVLSRVEIPLALPVISGGLRSAAVQVVATATLGAIFGFGGLGRYIVDGIAQNDNGQLFGGVVLVSALAVATELLFTLLQRVVTSPGLRLSQGPQPVRSLLAASGGPPTIRV